MRIGELAEATGASPRSLRYYEQHGLVHSRRTSNDYRDYDREAVTVVRNIRMLLAAGLGVGDIRAIRSCLHRELALEPGCETAIAVYLSRLADIDERRAFLDKLRTRLIDGLDEMRLT